MFLWKCCSCDKEIVIPYKGPEEMLGNSNPYCSECFSIVAEANLKNGVEHFINKENDCRAQFDETNMDFECRTLEQLGHIRLCSLSQFKQYKDDYDIKLLTVRHKGKINPDKYGMIHVDQLSPSSDLFNKYFNSWKKGKFTKIELRTIEVNDDTWFNSLYKPAFNKELESKESIVFLNRIEEILNKGINVLLICYCKELENCHLSLLGEYFANKKYEVIKN